MDIDLATVSESQEGSQLRRDLSARDVIMIKESRVVEKVGMHGADLEIAGLSLVTIRKSERKAMFGVKFEQAATSLAIAGSAFVDFDEIDNFDAGLAYVAKALEQMANSKRDYTEVTYTTRDGLIIGFYQDGMKQQPFMRFNVVSRAIHFSSPKAITVVQDAVGRSKSYAAERRAAWGFA